MLCIFFILIHYLHFSLSSPTCPSSLPSPLFSSKTGYNAVANHDTSPLLENGCSPLLYWSLVRHGTRYPDIDVIEPMKGMAEDLRWRLVKANSSQVCMNVKEEIRYYFSILNNFSNKQFT